MLKKMIPPKLYNEVENFLTTVEVTEDIAQMKQNTENNLKQEARLEQKKKFEGNLKFGFD